MSPKTGGGGGAGGGKRNDDRVIAPRSSSTLISGSQASKNPIAAKMNQPKFAIAPPFLEGVKLNKL